MGERERRIPGQYANGRRRRAHHEQRYQKRRLAADGVAKPAEEQRAEWPDRETERVRCERTEKSERRPVSGEEVRGDCRR